MPRDHARVNVTIWTDPDFRKLPLVAQHLYFMLWTSPALSYCGVHDWRPGRLAALADDLIPSDVELIGACLEARHFVVIDHDTEEVFIRSWARFDGLMKQPRMAVSYASAYAQVASEKLRSVLVHETHRIKNDCPNMACWNDKRVAEVLTHPSVSAKDLETPDDPFGDGFTPGLAQTSGRVSPRVCTPPTPTPAPTPTPCSPALAPDEKKKTDRKRPARSLPENWEPNDQHRAKAQELGVDINAAAETYRNHAAANDRRLVDWDAGFRTWLARERPSVVRPIRPNGEDPNAWMRRTL